MKMTENENCEKLGRRKLLKYRVIMGQKKFKTGFLIHKDLFRSIYHFLPLHVVIRIMIMIRI